MTVVTRVLNPDRRRQVPEHFSWLDHRLVQAHNLEKAELCAEAWYRFLVPVADAHGLSDDRDARRDRIALDLIAYDPPLTEALSLPESVPVAVRIE